MKSILNFTKLYYFPVNFSTSAKYYKIIFNSFLFDIIDISYPGGILYDDKKSAVHMTIEDKKNKLE